MMQTLIGPEAFRKAMDLYFERHDGEAATVEDLVKCMEDASGRSLEQFMLWYTQAGTPELAVAGKFRRGERVYELTVTQMTPPGGGQRKKQPLHIPLEIGLIASDGNALPLKLEGDGLLNRPVLEITKEEQTFLFTDVQDKPVPSLNRGFSCPVKLTSNLGDDDLLFLMSRDQDPFNRWEACQTYSGKKLLECVEDAAKKRPLRNRCAAGGSARRVCHGHGARTRFCRPYAEPAERKRPGGTHRRECRPVGDPYRAQPSHGVSRRRSTSKLERTLRPPDR